DTLEVHHHVAHAERAGAKTGNVAAGLERLAGGRRAVEDLEPVAAGIVEHDQGLHGALVGEGAGGRAAPGARRLHPGRGRGGARGAGSATPQPKKPMPWPPSASTTSRCLRSSMRKASEERLLSMRCRPRKFVP